MLGKIENQGKEVVVTDNLTIEHIMPQNENISSSWQKMLGNDWRRIKDQYIHNLGNLTLTGYNSELGDRPYLEKKAMLLDKAKTKVIYLIQEVENNNEWNEKIVKDRAQRLAGIVLSLYPIEGPSTKVSFEDPNCAQYGLDNINDATNKSPIYYVLQGERINCRTYADMLKSVVETLYQSDKSIIERLAANNEKILEWSQFILFSYDKNVVHSDYMIKGSNVYEKTGFSAVYIMYFIKALLELYDIAPEEFYYYARSTTSQEKLAVENDNDQKLVEEVVQSDNEEKPASNSTIIIRKVGITRTGTEVIVNAANSALQQGGGVCGIIFNAAGAVELQRACNRIGGCKTGSAVITPGFNLCKYIIHAVGPIYKDGNHHEPQDLYGCYRESLDLAKEYDCHSIAFPLISAGIFGYPKAQAWRKALQAVQDWINDNPDYSIEIQFAIIDDTILELGKETAKELGINLAE